RLTRTRTAASTSRCASTSACSTSWSPRPRRSTRSSASSCPPASTSRSRSSRSSDRRIRGTRTGPTLRGRPLSRSGVGRRWRAGGSAALVAAALGLEALHRRGPAGLDLELGPVVLGEEPWGLVLHGPPRGELPLEDVLRLSTLAPEHGRGR